MKMRISYIILSLMLVLMPISFSDYLAYSSSPKDISLCYGQNYTDFIMIKLKSNDYEVKNFLIYSNKDFFGFNESEFVVDSLSIKKIRRVIKADKLGSYELITYIKSVDDGIKQITQNLKIIDCTPITIKGLNKNYKIYETPYYIDFNLINNLNKSYNVKVLSNKDNIYVEIKNNKSFVKADSLSLAPYEIKQLYLFVNLSYNTSKTLPYRLIFSLNNKSHYKDINLNYSNKKLLNIKELLYKAFLITLGIFLLIGVLIIIIKAFISVSRKKKLKTEETTTEDEIEKEIKKLAVKEAKKSKKKTKNTFLSHLLNLSIVLLVLLLFFLIFKIVPVANLSQGITLISPSIGSSFLYLFNSFKHVNCDITIQNNKTIDLNKLFYGPNKLNFSIKRYPQHINYTIFKGRNLILKSKGDYIGQDLIEIVAKSSAKEKALNLSICVYDKAYYNQIIVQLNYYLHAIVLGLALLILLIMISERISERKNNNNKKRSKKNKNE